MGERERERERFFLNYNNFIELRSLFSLRPYDFLLALSAIITFYLIIILCDFYIFIHRTKCLVELTRILVENERSRILVKFIRFFTKSIKTLVEIISI